MKKLTKIMSLMAASALVISSLAGCGAKPATETTETTGSSAAVIKIGGIGQRIAGGVSHQ